ncbi:hypothetical protein KAJ27_07625 [bacterium]|nr:hypothetical protein [bacterium]
MNKIKIITCFVILAFSMSFMNLLIATEISDGGDENILAKPLKQKFREFSVYLNLSSKNLDEQEFKTKLNEFFNAELNDNNNESLEELNRDGDESVIIESVDVTKKILVEVKPGVDRKIIPLLISGSKMNHVKFNFKKINNIYSNSIEFQFTGSTTNMKKLGNHLLGLKQKTLYKLGTLLKR